MEDDLMNEVNQKFVINSQIFYFRRKKYFYLIKQGMFVDMHKKSLDVHFKNPAGIGIIL
ncbi:MAG: hypothetical protein WCI00_05735 [bacterium]